MLLPSYASVFASNEKEPSIVQSNDVCQEGCSIEGGHEGDCVVDSQPEGSLQSENDVQSELDLSDEPDITKEPDATIESDSTEEANTEVQPHVMAQNDGETQSGNLLLTCLSPNGLDLMGETTYQLDYTTYNPGQQESLMIILPPYFSVSSTPQNTPDYDVTEVTEALPENYYQGIDADILKKNVQNCNALLFTFKNTDTKTIQMNFMINLTKNSSDSSLDTKKLMTQLMVLYGENPDKIPLNTIAVAKNTDGTVIAECVTKDDSTLLSSSEMHIEKGSGTWGWYGRSGNALAYSGDFKANIGLSTAHYPYSDVKFYLEIPEGISLYPENESLYDITEKDGKRYIEYTKFTDVFSSTCESINLQQRIVLPDVDKILAGMKYEFGEILMDYTYKGKRYTGEKVYDITNDITVPKYSAVGKEDYYMQKRGSSSMESIMEDTNPLLDQDTSSKYWVRIDNYSKINGESIMPVYEDASVLFEFPYEMSPTNINISCMNRPEEYINYITSIEYKLHGTEESQYIEKVQISQNRLITFPIKDGEHIEKVIIHYSVLPSTGDYDFIFSVNNSSTDAKGNPLPEQFQTSIKHSVVTKSGEYTMGYGLAENERKYQFFEWNKEVKFLLVKEMDTLEVKTDGTYTRINCINKTNATYGYNYNLCWKILFTKKGSRMKDYPNSRIVLEPDDSNFSVFTKLTGFDFSNLKIETVQEKAEIFYKTNLSPEGKTKSFAQAEGTKVLLDLEQGEYPVYIEIQFGTIYGGNFEEFTVIPLFNDYRTYYSKEGVEIPVEDTGTSPIPLSAIFRTDTEGKLCDGVAINNKTYLYTLFKSELLCRDNLEVSYWQRNGITVSNSTFYKGDNIQVTLKDVTSSMRNVYYKSDNNYAPSAGNGVLYDLDLYLEVHDGISLKSVDIGDNIHFALSEIKEIQGSKNKLYKFSTTTSTLPTGAFQIAAYIEPGADIAPGEKLNVIKKAGYSWDKTVSKNWSPTAGDDAYYNDYPYQTVSIQKSNFPENWGVTDQYQMAFNMPTEIMSGSISVDKVILSSGKQNVATGTSVEFHEHEKSLLNGYAWMENISTSQIGKYEAVVELPREGKTTNGVDADGNTLPFSNAFSLFLKGGITVQGTEESNHVKITYYDEGGKMISLDDSLSEDEYKKAASFKVELEAFQAGAKIKVIMPLATDYSKTGANAESLFSYIGAKSRFGTSDTVNAAPFNYTAPVSYEFESYTLNVNIGLDSTENGAKASNLSDAATVRVYYKDGEEEKLLYEKAGGYSHSIPVNSDVTKVAVKAVDETTYRLTTQNADGVSEVLNSNFARVTEGWSELTIDKNDLINQIPNQYDAVFIVLPKVTVADVELNVNETAQSDPHKGLVKGTLSSMLAAKYKLSYAQTKDSAIAEIDGNGLITAKSAGDTAYTVTVTNTLGDQATADGKINVLSDKNNFNIRYVVKQSDGTETEIADTDTQEYLKGTNIEAAPKEITGYTFRREASVIPEKTIENGVESAYGTFDSDYKFSAAMLAEEVTVTYYYKAFIPPTGIDFKTGLKPVMILLLLCAGGGGYLIWKKRVQRRKRTK